MRFILPTLLCSISLFSSPCSAGEITRASLAGEVLAQYKDFSVEEKQSALSALCGRAETAQVLLDAVAAGTVVRTDVSGFHARQIDSLGKAELTAMLHKVWGRVAAKPTAGAVAEEFTKLRKQLTPATLAAAKLTQGRRLFNTTCGTCHQLFGEGKSLGPDLTGSNRKELEYLLENIVTPNALVGADYELNIVTMKSGKVVAGLVRKETESVIVVQGITTEDTLAKAEIATREKPGISLMPEGQLTAFSEPERRDLIAYLQSPQQVMLGGLVPAFDPQGNLPGALEAENLKGEATAGNVSAQNMSGFHQGRWSGAKHLWWTGAKTGATLSFQIPAAAGSHRLNIALTKAPDYAQVRISLNGKVAVEKFDGYCPEVTDSGALDLGTIESSGKPVDLKIEIIGKNPAAAPNLMVGVDYIRLD